MRNRKIIVNCLKKCRTALLAFAVITVLNCFVFLMYRMLSEPLIYSVLLSLFALIVFIGAEMVSEFRKTSRRKEYLRGIMSGNMPDFSPNSLEDEDYTEMISLLQSEVNRIRSEFNAKQSNADDYYTAWVHEIKTPIAVMKLCLNGDGEKDRVLQTELFRIERYVDMVLDYVRLESNSNDLVIEQFGFDEIIRDVLRKYASQFVFKKIRLSCDIAPEQVITDKKWLSFILDQLISNALKYTSSGEITVKAGQNVIRISDTGTGIATEDIPRIFEKGFTGLNGRINRKSSGLGLFLSQKAARLLSAEITCESVRGEGSTFTVCLPEKTE